MKLRLSLFALAAVLAGSAFASEKDAKELAVKVARGKYLVHTSACMDCHTPLKMGANGPEPDMSRLLSGHPQDVRVPPAPAVAENSFWNVIAGATMTAWIGPWGTSFTANLTPDPDTGLGNWTERDFRETIRTGRHMGRGRPVLPPMPIPVYQNFTDDDLGAIFAYLRTIPAVKNRVPEPLPPAAAKASR
ncbi:c-type cytochrome [Ramlibacter albus]|uniref:C-type cytochrome n=1 Tax=Ramlibacter albus TaxID=2079448 RepID=A0A923M5W4_9BURK|nr:c-type cytochrome [Ramlibacter albus]MBC5763346.1 c-type cytochrome [Ramlibacter albus]